ncbi:hypothetical protein ACSSS7_003872 [Eimeria intestinalis]
MVPELRNSHPVHLNQHPSPAQEQLLNTGKAPSRASPGCCRLTLSQKAFMTTTVGFFNTRHNPTVDCAFIMCRCDAKDEEEEKKGEAEEEEDEEEDVDDGEGRGDDQLGEEEERKEESGGGDGSVEDG